MCVISFNPSFVSFEPKWHLNSPNHKLTSQLFDAFEKTYKPVLHTLFQSYITGGFAYLFTNMLTENEFVSIFVGIFFGASFILFDGMFYHPHDDISRLNQSICYPFISQSKILPDSSISFIHEVTQNNYYMIANTDISIGSLFANRYSIFLNQPESQNLNLNFGRIEILSQDDFTPSNSPFSFQIFHNGFYQVVMSLNSNAFTRFSSVQPYEHNSGDATYGLFIDSRQRFVFGLYFLKGVSKGQAIQLRLSNHMSLQSTV